MIREQVIVTTLSIKKAGQVKHFQVKLPQNTKRVIGVEMGVRWVTERIVPILTAEPKIQLAIKQNQVIGEVKLQSCDEANVFYAGQIITDENRSYGDFSKKAGWKPSEMTHQNQQLEDTVIVDGKSTILQGMYQDVYAKQLATVPDYKARIYVWIEREEPIQTEK